MKKLVPLFLIASMFVNQNSYARGFGRPVISKSYIGETNNQSYIECFIKACDIIYTKDSDLLDLWQTPKQTIERKKGDCEDMSFYLYSLLKEKGIESRVVIGYINNKPWSGHCWVEINFKGDIMILDSAGKKIFTKQEYYNSNNQENYKEYPESYGFKKDIEEFIKRFESGDERPFISKLIKPY